MTDKENLSKVRAEIEKYQKQIQAGAVDNRISKEKAEAYRICVKLISIIDSMLEEPTISLWHDKVEEPEPDKELICIGQFNNPLVLSSSSDSFRWNFILKWAYFDDLLKLSNVERNGKDLQEEPVSEDLEAEIKKTFLNNECSVTDAVSLSAFTRIARHFANWQKQQIRKDAISGKVTVIYYPTDSCLEIEATLPEDRFEDGDKVLIIKED